MSVLFPAMLLGLAGLAVPVVLHLIARHKYQVQEFPSIQLLRADERTNVFAMRLVDTGQLLLRLAVLLLLVLAMARLVAGWWPFGRAARNLVVVVDASASMQAKGRSPIVGRQSSLMELAKAKAEELLRGVAPPSQCALVAAGGEAAHVAPLQPSPRRALEALEGLKPGEGAGRGLVHALAASCNLVRGRREARSQIVVLTDLAASAFEARNQDDLRRIQAARDELGRKLEIIFVDVAGGPAENLAILDARVRGSRAKVGDDAHVVARVLNSSAGERKAKLQLAVGERKEPAVREIALEPGGEADVDLTLRATRAGRTVVEARLEGADAIAGDDRFAVPLDVADARRVLIVSGGAPEGGDRSSLPGSEIGNRQSAVGNPEDALDGVKILRFVLNPGRELGRPYGTGIHTTVVTPEALAGQPLSKYDLVVLHDVSTLPEAALADLGTFARQGRALLFVCSRGTNAMQFNRVFAAAAGGQGGLSPAEVGNDRALDPPIGLRHWDGHHPLLAPFRDRLRGDLSTVRFAAVREIRRLAEGASVMLAGADGRPLAVEMPLGQGRAALLAFGFELDRGNVARTRVFPALVWQLVSYLAGEPSASLGPGLRSRQPDVLTADRPAVLDVSEPAFAFLDELELAPLASPSSAPLALAVGPDRTVLVPGLPIGRYVLEKPQKTAGGTPAATRAGAPASLARRYVAVNHDPRESRTARVGEAQLPELLGVPVRVAKADDSLSLQPPGGELWPLLAVLLIAAYGLEGGVGWLLNARRERRRSEGASQ